MALSDKEQLIFDILKGKDTLTPALSKSKKAAQKLDKAISGIAKVGGIASAVVGGLGAIAIGSFAKAAGEVETLSTQLEVLTGSADNAKKLMEELTDFSASTPFQLPGITKAAQRLLSFQFTQETVIERLQELGDVAAGSGADIGELTLIYGQVAAAGKLTGERLLQLQERAIPIGPALANSMGVAQESIRKLVTEGKVQFADFEKAFNTLNDEGGQFFQGMVKRSQTLEGVTSTLADNFFILKAEIGAALKPALIESAKELTKAFQEITEAFKTNGPEMVRVLSSLAKVLVIEPTKFWSDVLVGKISTSLPQLNKEIAELEKRSDSLAKRFSKAKDSPFGAIATSARAGTKSADTLNRELAETIETLSKLKRRRDEILKSSEVTEDFIGPLKPSDADLAKIELQEMRFKASEELKTRILQEQLEARNAINEDNIVGAFERDVEREEAELLRLETNLLKKQELESLAEMQKQLQKAKSLEEIKKIEDKFNKEQLKKQIKDTKDSIKLTEDEEKKKVAIRQATFTASANLLNALSSLSALGGRKTFGITKALALAAIPINTAAGIMKAFAELPPFAAQLQAAAIGVTGAVQLAKVASSKPPSFAQGGILDGRAAGDLNVAKFNGGEAFLTKPQQAEFMNIARGNSPAREIGEEGLLQALLSQPIVLQINNRELARATREANLDGFAIS